MYSLLELISIVQVVVGVGFAYLQFDQFNFTKMMTDKIMEFITKTLNGSNRSYAPENIGEEHDRIISLVSMMLVKKSNWTLLIFKQKFGTTMTDL
ncbi:hypothetical protein [Candidatus Magnetomonas plexicatena]|uniref:hypothetical protein n=1 Tax=Candidatus Magnetomonas plexicatena TaxID=2552947 RepID=UPI0011013AE5|nr:hypothetical protein E2O03_014820 [Nitrospirales bacterium LBB_01]